MGTLDAELLGTKVKVPPLRSGMVTRHRLRAGLEDAARCKLTVVAARAGAGKTTLLSQWTSEAWPGRCAWVSLDPTDSDPLRFLRNLILSLRQVVDNLAPDGVGLFHASRQPTPDDVGIALMAHIARVPDDILVILDDFHVLRGEGVPQLLSFLLLHTPSQLHWAISSRRAPGISLSRLRVEGELVELGDDSLAFTDDETSSYFEVHGPALNLEQTVLLGRKTEGWAAGLQMAALSLRNGADPQSFVQAFSGEVGIVGDYLVDEVLSHQSEEMLGFMRRTALLDQLCGALCNAVTGDHDGQKKLEAMERSGLFVVPLDRRRRWYRYHHLFAEFISARYPLAEHEVVDVHSRAYRWFEAAEDLETAIHYAVAAGAWDQVARLIQRLFELRDIHVADLFRISEWIEGYLKAVERPDGEFILGYAWCLMQLGDWQRSAQFLDQAEARWLESRDPKIGVISAARSVIAVRQGDGEGALREARAAERHMAALDPAKLSRRELRFWLICKGQLGVAQLAVGLPGEAIETLKGLCAASAARGFAGAVNSGTSCLQEAYWMLGRLSDSRRLGEERLAVGDGEAIGMRYWIAVVDYERNHLAEAEAGLLAARRYARGQQREEQATKVALALARVCFAQGRLQDAHRELEHCRYLSGLFADERESRNIEAMAVRIALAQGWSEEIAEWMSGLLPLGEESFLYIREEESLVLALTLIHRRLFAEAFELLAGLRLRAEQDGRRRSVISILAHQALLRQTQANGREARRLLQEALDLGSGEGFVRTFVDLGPALENLLRRQSRRDESAAYVRLLFDAWSDEPGSTSTESPWCEPLSERELEVVQLLSTELTNASMAKRLHISTNTLKTHLKSIYTKLGVANRAQATAKVISLGLTQAGLVVIDETPILKSALGEKPGRFTTAERPGKGEYGDTKRPVPRNEA